MHQREIKAAKKAECGVGEYGGGIRQSRNWCLVSVGYDFNKAIVNHQIMFLSKKKKATSE